MSDLMMKYFVLKPSGDDAYSKASRAALRTYATQIRDESPELCRQLREWADNETPPPEPMTDANAAAYHGGEDSGL